MYWIWEPQEIPDTTNLGTIGPKYGVSQSQWPRMTLERSRCNVAGQIWSCSGLNHAWCLHSSQWQQVTETRFRWKAVGGYSTYDVIRDLTWPGQNVFAKSCAKDAPLAVPNFSAIRQALRGHFRKKNLGCCVTPSVPASRSAATNFWLWGGGGDEFLVRQTHLPRNSDFSSDFCHFILKI